MTDTIKYLDYAGLVKFKEELDSQRLADKLEITSSLNTLSGDVGNGTLTIKRNNTTLGTFSANQKTNDDINISVPTSIADLGLTAITEILNLINYGLLDVSNLTDEQKEALHDATTASSDFITDTDLATELADYGKIINYDSSTLMIQLKNGNTVLSQFSAADFISDGMIQDISITNGTGSNLGKSVLLIDFNTDSGITDIEIPLEDIFDASNYYTKSEIDNAGFLTLHQDISGKANSADLATVATSGSYADLSNKPTVYSAQEIQNIIQYGVADISGYTSQELENLEKYGVADVSELTELEIAELEEEKGQYAKVSDVYDKTTSDSRYIRIITLNSVPTSSTLTYTLDGVTYNFKPGDEVRVLNGDNSDTNDYQIYKLYDLVTESNVTTAYWSESGSGGGLDDIVETCIVNLSTSNSTYNSELVGVATVTFTIDGQDTVKTWNGNSISMKILSGVSYTVTIGNVIGFTTPSGFTRTAIAGNTQEFNGTYTYRNISVTVGTNQNSLTDLIGATIKIDGTEFEINNTLSTTQTFIKHVASSNNAVSFVFDSVSGYRSPSITDDGSQDSFNVTYDTEILSITTVTTDSGTVTGQSITIDNETKTWLGTTLTWKIPFGNSDIITATKEGFTVEIIKNPNTDTADSISKTATIVFEEIVEGVYAYSNKKREVTDDNINSTTLDSGEYYIGVLVRASGIEFVIDKRFPTGTAAAPDSGNYKSWSPALLSNDPASASDGRQLIYHGEDYGFGSDDVNNYYTVGAPTNLRTWATQNYTDGHTGFANTELIRKLSTVAAETATNNALKYCHACVTEINNRAIYGYAGSVAEWIAVLDNITEINSILSKIGGTQFTYSASGQSSYSYFRASNEFNSGSAWLLFFNSSYSYPYMSYNSKSNANQSYCARPFYLPNLYTTEIKVVTANGSVVNIEDGNSTCVGVLVRNTYENIEYYIDKRFPTGSAAGASVGNYKSWYSSNIAGGTTAWTATTKTSNNFGEGITTDFREKAITAYLGGATGVQNTNTIISTLSSGTVTNCAAKYCRSIANPVTGAYDGYLGSAAEWILIVDNLSLINEALTQIGGVTFESTTSGYISNGTSYTRWWTSSDCNSHDAWLLFFSSSYSYPYMSNINKSRASQDYCARPFFKLS